MEKHGSDIVQVTIQGENALASDEGPHPDQIVVTTGHKKRLRWVEIDTSNWTLMILKTVDKSAHTVIP